MESEQPSHEYNVSVHSNNVYEAIATTANALYALIEESLGEHEGHEDDECEFEAFARDVLGVLDRHGDQISGGAGAWDEAGDELPHG